MKVYAAYYLKFRGLDHRYYSELDPFGLSKFV